MPKIKNKSKQYLFKNKLKIRRKSKIEMMKESFFMMILGAFLILIIYLIPEKMYLFNSFKKNLFDVFGNILEILFDSLEILIVLLICFIFLISAFLIFGSIVRVGKIVLSRQRKFRFR
tara:strand:- start:276 stop:629 length:354 start_codon:yes stop_codon:yes gene_type:complete